MKNLMPSQKCDDNYNVYSGSIIPDSYRYLDTEEISVRITRARNILGKSLVVLGHHYQRDEIIEHTDFQGDSFKLSLQAAQREDSKYIVFCGVHFMAESADMLSSDEQVVILPNLAAGCSMADMANIQQVETCWKELREAGIQDVIPVTYINSAANLKAFVGKNGGVVCTSSNAPKAIAWAMKQSSRVLFFPDQHLGRITAFKLGIPLEKMILWDPAKKMGGNEYQHLRDKRVFLWKGYCSVHARFTQKQIHEAREKYPGIKVIVHPECSLEVVLAADEYGSTEYIAKRIRESEPGTKWAVGTEINLVSRLADEMPDKFIMCLDSLVCPCVTMYQIHPAFLCWVLEELVNGHIINQIIVPDDIKKWAKIALNRMLELK
jgi:quinolinate synthase